MKNRNGLVVTMWFFVLVASSASANDAQVPSKLLKFLTEELSQDNSTSRIQVLRAIAGIGPEAVAILPRVIPFLQDPSADVRYAAAEAVARTGTTDPTALRALIAALVYRDLPDAELTASTIAAVTTYQQPIVESIAKVTPQITSHLLEAMKSKSVCLRLGAAECLARLSSPPPQALELLHSAYSSAQPPAAREQLLHCLKAVACRRGPGTEQALKVAEKLLADAEPLARKEGLSILRNFGSLAHKSLPKVEARLKDPVDYVRAECVETLPKIGGDFERTAAMIIPLLSDKEVCVAAAKALGHMGNPIAVPALTAVIAAESSEAKFAAIDALEKIGRNYRPATEALIRCLQDSDWRIRAKSAWVLGQIADSEPLVMDALAKAAQDTDERVQHAAKRSLDHLRGAKRLAAKGNDL